MSETAELTNDPLRPVRLVVVGGFLASGKTTTILRLAQHWAAAGKRVGIITNDQAADLVDTDTFRSAGLDALEVAGGCFCCRFDDFIARADDLIARARPDIILAEPVGSCTDIVATVLNPLRRLHAARFEVAPYVVLVDAVRALKVLGRTERVGLSERVTYIYRMQQQEADAVAISKIDLLAPDERERVEHLVREQFPGRDLLPFSARTGEGFETLLARLGSDTCRAAALRDLDYDVYAEGEAELGWLNSRIGLEGPRPIVLDERLLQLGRDIQTECRDRGVEIAHGKLLLRSGPHAAAVSLVGAHRPLELSRSSGEQASSAELTINLRVQTEPSVLDEIVRRRVAIWAEEHGLRIADVAAQSFKPGRPVPTHRMPSANA